MSFAFWIPMQLPHILALYVAVGGCLACQGHEARASDTGAPHAPAGKKARTTPAVIAKAESLLEENPDAPIGTTMEVTIEGRTYVARFEEHENRTGDPERPPGKHKGVTVYEK